MVAPVLEAGALGRSAYFPDGTWYRLTEDPAGGDTEQVTGE